MLRHAAIAVALTLLITTSSHALGKTDIDAHVTRMFEMIHKHDPASAIAEADIVIADYKSRFNDAATIYVCAGSGPETIANLMIGGAAKQRTVAVSEDWCSAYFVKGYALIDLNRSDLAEPELRQATEMAPFNAHYLNEYAELFKLKHEWQKSYDLFSKALDVAPLNDESTRAAVTARSLRGMGYAKIELNELDEAERLMKQSLEFEPESAGARSELQYIARKKAAGF